MADSTRLRIEIDAASMLTRLKARFAQEVFIRASQLASEGDVRGIITQSHIRQAAASAIKVLSDLIDDEVCGHAEQNAA